MGEAYISSFNLVLGVFLLDLLLSGDNAVLIAMASRHLRPDHRVRAIWYGTAAAFLFRLLLTSIASLLMAIPGLRLAGGLMLIRIAIQLLTDDDSRPESFPGSGDGEGTIDNVASAVRLIVTADLVMSLDNVLALSALTHGDWQMLVLGLLVSIPCLTFGSLLVSTLLDDYPLLVSAGGALLGWVAGDLAITDALFGAGIREQSPALLVVVPLLCALYVVLQSRIIVAARAEARTRRPELPLFAGLFGGKAEQRRPARRVQPVRIAAELEAIALAPEATLAAEPLVSSMDSPGPTDALAVSRPGPAAPSPRRRIFASGAAAFALMLLAGGLYAAWDHWHPPSASGLDSFECLSPKATVLFKAGAGTMTVTTASGFDTAKVEGGKIFWSDYRSTSQAIGFPPPTDIVSSSQDSIVLNGGMFVTSACALIPPPP